MADSRMLSRSVCESDAFLSMPQSSQSLYLHLLLNADDCGMVTSPLRVARMCNAVEDDLKLLAAKGFVLLFASGVVAIADFYVMNSIGRGRLTLTPHLDEISMLHVRPNGRYTFADEGITAHEKIRDRVRGSEKEQEKLRLWERDLERRNVLPTGCAQKLLTDCADTLATSCEQVLPTENADALSSLTRLDQAKLTKQSEARENEQAPTLAQVQAYVEEKGYSFDAQRFHSYYAAINWRKGGEPINWKAQADYWESTQHDRSGNAHTESINAEYLGSW